MRADFRGVLVEDRGVSGNTVEAGVMFDCSAFDEDDLLRSLRAVGLTEANECADGAVSTSGD